MVWEPHLLCKLLLLHADPTLVFGETLPFKPSCTSEAFRVSVVYFADMPTCHLHRSSRLACLTSLRLERAMASGHGKKFILRVPVTRGAKALTGHTVHLLPV